MIPAWILDIFAALMLVVAGISASRLLAERSWARPAADADIDAAHVLMGIAMAGMLAGGLQALPNSVWVAVFAVVTAWFAGRVAREARMRRDLASVLTTHHVPHLIHGAAMIYMFAAFSSPAAGAAGSAMGGMGSMGGSMGTLHVPTIGLVFVLIMAGWAVLDIDQISKSGRGGARSDGDMSVPAGLRHRLAVAAAGTSPALAPMGPADDTLATMTTAAAPATTARSASGKAPGSSATAPAAVVRGILDPRVATTCRIAMGVTMALMLVLMI
jgi:Domain of unknown function (DUF5134)